MPHMEIRENKCTVSIRKLFFCKTKLRVIAKNIDSQWRKRHILFLQANLEIPWKLPGKVALGKLLWGAMDLSPLNPRVARGSWRDQKLGRKRILGCFTSKNWKFIMEKCGLNGMKRDCRTNGLTTKCRWKVIYTLTKSHKYFANNGKIMHYVILCIKTVIWPCVWDFGCFGTNPIWGASQGILGIDICFLKAEKIRQRNAKLKPVRILFSKCWVGNSIIFHQRTWWAQKT